MNMKKKVWYVMLLMAAMFAGCAAERDGQQTLVSNGMAGVNPDSVPVGFDAYQQRSTTRSGWAGTLGLEQLKKSKANGGGFGVFAYYTDLKKYDQTYVPNFMYNQGVFWNETSNYWEYSPITYWPNEYGFSAASDDEDHLSFFAYAPYVQHKSAAAGSVDDATYGIIGFSRNTATGDPMVRYVASFEPSKSVDMCWGVVPSDKTFRASNPNLTVQQMLTVYLRQGNPKAVADYAQKLIQQAGVAITPGEKTSSLSGGMLQRLILTRELAENPSCIILCNPLQGLDKRGQRKMTEVILRLSKQGKAVLIVGAADFPLSLCASVYALESGSLRLVHQETKGAFA